ncbi:MAG: DUF4393 domain-containing protein [Sphingomonas sp.]|nr:DUF4393 domain-containing protein [Sphingomonas sp.]RZV49754.1 MAG: DUF4393 domain-containing protein [Sphingomonadaceae bacterium]
MTDPISLGLAIGGGAWLADKLLGPSAEAIGDQLKAYAGDRIRKIFDRAETKIDPIAVKPLPPGFAMIFVQRASSSEEDENLTEMWANLLKSAAESFSSRHTAYAEILSQLTPLDAQSLEELVPADTLFFPALAMPVNLRVELRLKITNEMKNVSSSKEEAQEEFDRLMNCSLDWPGRITSARIHYKDGDVERPLTGGISDLFATHDNLYRLGLIERFEIDNSSKRYETAVEGVLVTALGVGFIQTCRGLVK